MKHFLVLAAIFGCSLGAHLVADKQVDEDFRIAGYLPEYRVDAMDPSQIAGLTDLIAFSVSPRSDGSLDTKNWPNGKLDKARNLAT